MFLHPARGNTASVPRREMLKRFALMTSKLLGLKYEGFQILEEGSY